MKHLGCLIICVIAAACGDGKGTPEDAGGDPCLVCAASTTCDPTAATPCICPAGYHGDGTQTGTGCTDVDECAAGISTCDLAHGTCTNTTGSFTCACAAGFTGDGSTTGTGCSDIDECATDANECDNFTCVNTPGAFHCEGLYAVNPFDSALARLDPRTYALLDVTALSTPPPALSVAITPGTVSGVTAMARHPVTGVLYVVAKVSGVSGRAFGTLDLATGVITVIASVDKFSSLEFLPDGTLFGDTGAGATVAKSLYTIDPATGATTLFGALGHGSDGEVICYDRDAELMYHWSGNGTALMESFPMASPVVTTNVSPGLTDVHEVFGCEYIGNHTFRVMDISNHVRLITSAGVVSTPPDAVTDLFAEVRATQTAVMTNLHTARPRTGATAGGTTVTLRGLGLTGATDVKFGSVAAASFTVVDDTTITAVTPAGTGMVDIVVTTPHPYPATWPAAFTFADPGALAAPAVRASGATLRPTPRRHSALQRKLSRSSAR